MNVLLRTDVFAITAIIKNKRIVVYAKLIMKLTKTKFESASEH